MLKKVLRKFIKRRYRFKRIKILGRVACLGQDVLNLTFKDYGLNNHQKSRVDFLLNFKQYDQKNLVVEVGPHLSRKDIAGIIDTQEDDFFSYGKPDYIVIDSFSELTDQLFLSTNGKRAFLANYSDIAHEVQFKNKFVCDGLLDVEHLHRHYDLFFEKLGQVYGNTPVFYISFPVKFEKRDAFIKRAAEINKSIQSLSLKYPNLHFLALDDVDVERSEDEDDVLKDFPYHYSKLTYDKFSKKLRSIIEVIS